MLKADVLRLPPAKTPSDNAIAGKMDETLDNDLLDESLVDDDDAAALTTVHQWGFCLRRFSF